MRPATSAAAALPMPADWRKAAAPVGVAVIRTDPGGGGVRVELDQAAAAAIGWPAFVAVELASREMTITPCNAGDVGARATAPAGGGLAFTARVASKRRTLGQWPAWAHGAGLVLDLAGRAA